MAVSISDVKLKSAKPEEKPYRIPVGENVYLEVLPNGRKVWRMRYLKLSEKKPAIYISGDYPDIPLKAQAHSFETIAREWHQHRRDSLQRWRSAKNANTGGCCCDAVCRLYK
ncbi:hypothetical protein SAMN02745130_01194 [Thiothrix eikelboomii]|uniref:Integrase DNA-binding domain-containing protein n=1 Tax=Thiothrix eikelboomii TaxID=92487 RepID=A0A1T4W7U1_9GAMM|nr:Arm DNA-binding domain-containing protein [Thiothrix eikelboomii]SKA73267.1 hypothetical protein SAMN02745130_01194 [Thiothrix eikelboomii]